MGLLHSSGLDAVGAIVGKLDMISVVVGKMIDVSVAKIMGVLVGKDVGVKVSAGRTAGEVGAAV